MLTDIDTFTTKKKYKYTTAMASTILMVTIFCSEWKIVTCNIIQCRSMNYKAYIA